MVSHSSKRGWKKIHTLRSVFDVRNIKKLPNVVIIYGYQDDPEYMYDAAIAHHADGIIYAGTGAGSVSVRSDAGIKKRRKPGLSWCALPAPETASYRWIKGSQGWCLTRSTRRRRESC